MANLIDIYGGKNGKPVVHYKWEDGYGYSYEYPFNGQNNIILIKSINDGKQTTCSVNNTTGIYSVGSYDSSYPNVTEQEFNAFYSYPDGNRITGTPGSETPTSYEHGKLVEVSWDNATVIARSNDPYLNVIAADYIVDTSGKPFEQVSDSYVWTGMIKNAYRSYKVFHDIYVEGDNKPSIYIHTHHNIDDAQVQTYIYKGTCTKNLDALQTQAQVGNYNYLGFCQYDKGMIQDFTFEQLHDEGINNNKLGTFTAIGESGIAFKFNDIITGPSGRGNNFSNYACINEKAQTGIDANVYQRETVTAVPVIRFFSGKPSDDIQRESDRGQAGDETNYDGSDKRRRDDTDYSEEELHEGSDEGSAGIFHDIYKVTNVNMKSLHNKLWTQEYYDVFKVNENPMDNIISCKRYPFNVEAGTDKNIIIGNIDTNVVGSPVSNGIYRKTLGSITFYEKFRNFLDYYDTNLSIYLPFIGVKPLPTVEVMGKTLAIKYLIDILTGSCKARLEIDGFLFAEYDGSMGIDCTLSASTQKQSEIANAMRLANAAGSIVGGVAGSNAGAVVTGIEGLLSNGVVNHFQSTQSGAAISNASVIDCYVIYDMPVPVTGTDDPYPKNYAKTVGIPCGLTKKISDMRGFTKCGGDIDFPKSLVVSDRIKSRIISKMRSGFEV